MSDHDHDHAHHHEDETEDDLAELLDLDAEVLHSYWADVLTWVQREAATTARILDLGAGTGTGTIALAQRFAGAEVIAVDAAEERLDRITVKASGVGLADRVRTVPADLDGEWPDVGAIDLMWASMSLHHLADPDRVLRDVFAATRPGGLAVVVEMSDHLRFLPDDLGVGRPGLERRCLDALGEEHAQALPELGTDWSPRLAAAGFTPVGEQAMAIDVGPPQSAAAIRYAELWLRRVRSRLTPRLAADDLDVLATLLDGDGPESLPRRGDLHLHGGRTVSLARRAPSDVA